jgi:hypothetical protein
MKAECRSSVLIAYGFDALGSHKFLPVCITGNEYYWGFFKKPFFAQQLEFDLSQGYTPKDILLAVRLFYEKECGGTVDKVNAMLLQRYSYPQYNGKTLYQCAPPDPDLRRRIGTPPETRQMMHKELCGASDDDPERRNAESLNFPRCDTGKCR